MPMWTRHKVALFPDRAAVCGVSLLPPTVAQVRLLEHVESPLMTGGTATAGDLALLVILCWLPAGVGRWLLRHGRLLAAAVAWVGWRARRSDWRQEVFVAQSWLDSCMWIPARIVSEKEQGGAPPYPLASPYTARIIWHLCERFTERRVLAMSIVEASLYMLARAEAEGNQFETLDDFRRIGIEESEAYDG
jgi:hypothetical protein